MNSQLLRDVQFLCGANCGPKPVPQGPQGPFYDFWFDFFTYKKLQRPKKRDSGIILVNLHSFQEI